MDENYSTSSFSRRLARLCLVGALVAAAGAGPQSAERDQASEHTCFPTCGVDGRFLVLTGNDPTTLAASQVLIGLNFPSSGNRGDFDLFDGDRDATRWDVKNPPSNANPPQLELEIYTDASGTGTGGTLVKKWNAGDIEFANSDWTGVTWTHAPAALAGSGAGQSYRYALKISATRPAEDLGWNAFKVRTRGTIHLAPQVIGFIASMVVPGDLPSIYPSYPDLGGSTYDGSWSFKFRVPAGAEHVTIHDGDMDYGDAACTISDTDDRDSTDVPAFGVGAIAEGVAATGLPCSGGAKGSRTGVPAEDNAGAAFKRVPTASGAGVTGIVYRVIAPDGQMFMNRNPSGNREWEQFKIVRAGNAPANCPAAGFATHDCTTASIPEGLWEIRVDGMDLSNLNFFHLNFRIER